MADERYDILLNVRNSGVTDAVANLKTLQRATGSIASGASVMGSATKKALDEIARGAGTADVAVKNLNRAWDASGKQAGNFTQQLRTLERAYSEIARLNPTGGPEAWLSTFGKGSASAVQALRAVFSADPVRDLMAVQRQQQALQDAGFSKTQAQARLTEASLREQQSGLTRVQVAEGTLARAKEARAAAERASTSAEQMNARVQANATLGLEARVLMERAAVSAINQHAAAIEKQIQAERELNQAREADGDFGSAFQQSFPFFILGGMATKLAGEIRDIGAASLQASMDTERGFANVERTFEGTSGQLASLKNRLYELSTETPVSFVDLAEMASLGNQLGIGAADIESFTSTIARFSAISGQSAEDSATAFGKIANLTGLSASQFENLGSAIEYTARTTVATEATITRTSQEIAALASGAGFSAQSIVGLAGAMSSLAIPPERARGSLSLYFGALNGAVAEGGPKLEAFATLVGTTVQELDEMVRNNRGEEVFTRFLSGLGELNNVAKTTALDTLGLSTIRVDQTMRAMSASVDLVESSLAGANKSFAENTELQMQYAIIQATLDSKWKEFQNSVHNLASAFGDALAPAAKDVLTTLTDLLVEVTAFAKSPLGKRIIEIVAAVGLFVGAMAAVLGVLALARASMVILGAALAQLGFAGGIAGLKAWTASLIASTTAAVTGTGALRGYSAGVVAATVVMGTGAAAARVFAFALAALKVAAPILAITAAIALFTTLGEAIDRAINPSKNLTEDLTGLTSALRQDNAEMLARGLDRTSTSSTKAQGPVSAFNQALLTAIEVQRAAEGALNSTTGAIDAQAFALGDAGKAWLADALKAQSDIKDIIDGRDFWDVIFETTAGGDANVSQDQFYDMILGGLDLNEISQIAITRGEDAAKAAFDGWAVGYKRANPDAAAAVDAFGFYVLPNILSSVSDAYDKAQVEAALMGTTIDEVAGVTVAGASEFDEYGNALREVNVAGGEFMIVFSGVTDRLIDFQKGVGGAMDEFVAFDNVLKRAEGTAEAVAKALEMDEAAPVNVIGFADALNEGITSAETFYKNIMTLADSGNSSLALQFAEMGADASGILGEALTLSAEDLANLEKSARFAGFLASDAFMESLNTNLVDMNEAYARILGGGGTLEDVKSYISALVDGTGQEWEAQWLAKGGLPLSVTPELSNLSPEEIDLFQKQFNGEITVTPKVKITEVNPGQFIEELFNVYTDATTGRTITLPASLSQEELTASLLAWQANQTGYPTGVASFLRTDTFGSDAAAGVAGVGTVLLPTILNVTGIRNVPTDIRVGAGTQFMAYNAKGGLLDKYGQGHPVPEYATGGLVRGPGSGTSDSIWSKVSQGEYINTAKAVNFWGADVFEALNRNMLPTRFAGMLAQAAVSGNQGPSQVTNVNVTQNYPVTRDPVKEMRDESERVMTGQWE